jgi:hypothetical protein
MVKGAAAQVTHNIDILGGCATGSLGDCGQVWNQLGPNGAGYAALQSAQGAVTAAGSIYHNLSDGHIPYAAGQIIAIAGIFAVTRGIGAGAEGTGAADAGATANSGNWFSRLFSRAAESCTAAVAGGGMSFTAGTKVLTASGAVVAISKLKTGDKVLATSTKTGKTTAETVSAVLVHHDTNRYNLTVKTVHGTAVIDTTSNHLFWDATTHRWVKAAALKYGTHLRTPSRATATALGGNAPKDRSGWMWDLTIPGNHDFYIQAATTAILVHNINDPCEGAPEAAPPLGDTSNLLPGYKTFSAAKADLGSPGAGNVFDHTVEQSQIARSGFTPEEINSPYNMNPIPPGLNQAKNAYYSSKQFFTAPGTVRDWLTGQSFADQYEFSMDVLMKIRNGLPLP